MNRRRRRRRTRLRLALAITPVALLAAALAIGHRLPREIRTEARLDLPSPPETVWAVLTDVDAIPTWRPDLVAVERLPASGDVVRWVEVGPRTRLAVERVEAVAPERLVIRTASAGPERSWIYTLLPVVEGTRLTVVEERVVSSPLARVVLRLPGVARTRLGPITSGLWKRVDAHRQQLVARPSP